MGKIKRPSIFKHKDGTMLTKEEEEAAELRFALSEVINEIQDSQVEISEAELEQRIREIFKAYNTPFPYDIPPAVSDALRRKAEHLNQIANNTPHTCTQCGAPLKDGKCEYCGTIYN